jgi:hypothetical protein
VAELWSHAQGCVVDVYEWEEADHPSWDCPDCEASVDGPVCVKCGYYDEE